MKTFALLLLATGFVGCTTPNNTAQNQPAPRTFGERRVYSGEELNNTGHTTPGRQLERLDPAIESRGPGE